MGCKVGRHRTPSSSAKLSGPWSGPRSPGSGAGSPAGTKGQLDLPRRHWPHKPFPPPLPGMRAGGLLPTPPSPSWTGGENPQHGLCAGPRPRPARGARARPSGGGAPGPPPWTHPRRFEAQPVGKEPPGPCCPPSPRAGCPGDRCQGHRHPGPGQPSPLRPLAQAQPGLSTSAGSALGPAGPLRIQRGGGPGVGLEIPAGRFGLSTPRSVLNSSTPRSSAEERDRPSETKTPR